MRGNDNQARTKAFAKIMSVILVVGLMPLPAYAEPGDAAPGAQLTAGLVASGSVNYVERSWDGEKVVSETRAAEGVTDVPADGKMTSGWYYLASDVTVKGRISLAGDTNLILGDGCTLDVKGIYVPQGSTLTIYAQSDGEGAGAIYSHPSSGAAIGAYSGHKGGEVVIHGGNITANGHDHCAGIGSNDGDGTTAPITIYGGSITAKGGSDGAGIGGGRGTNGGNITIYGGDVTGKGGGENGAGIGGGDDAPGGTITINGGVITANEDPNEDGAGIGGGDGGDGGAITINGGNITTYSRDGAGIGGGDDGDGGTITIKGGTVTCWDEGHAQGARIGGGCDGDGGTITITGGTVDVHFRDGAGIGGGEAGDGGTINISGGTITTHPEGEGNGAGIGGGNHSGAGGTINISGGVVNASGKHSAGIGGGRRRNLTYWETYGDKGPNSGAGGRITISGGEVHAYSDDAIAIGAGGQNDDDHDYWDARDFGTAGTITIKDSAVVYAHGYRGGIGGDSGTINIEGGTVTAGGIDDDLGYGIKLMDKSGKINISGGTVHATGWGGCAGISTDKCALTITGGTVYASSDKGSGIGAGWEEKNLLDQRGRAKGKVTIKGEGTKVYAKSDKRCAIGGEDAPKYEFGPGAIIEAISGDTDHQSNAFYEGSRVKSGKDKESAELVNNVSRKSVQKYRLIEPCDHEGTMTGDVCWACGYAGDITCVERSWVDGELVSEWKAPENPIPFPASDNATLAPGWYYLNQNVTADGRVSLTGDTHLILCQNNTLNVKGIHVPEGSTLYVYGQNLDSSKDTGKIYSHPSGGAGIGGYSEHDNGNIVIHGGVVEAKGADHCAGIGSNDGRKGGAIDIYGGTITAIGGSDGAAIGGGRECDGGNIDIYGGTINANGSDDSSCNENGAGIGGGDGGDGGDITIYGGTVTAYSRDGAGIGGGDGGDGGNITINGGSVNSHKVNQGQGARIGGGCDADGGTVTINGGAVTTESGSGAGIGGGKRCVGGSVAINGGVVSASGSYGVGNGEDGSDVAVTLDYTDDTKEGISVEAANFGGTVTLEKPFCNDAGVFEAGTQGDLAALAGSKLRAWDGDILSWGQLQRMIDAAGEGDTITLTRDLEAKAGDSDLVITEGKDLTIDLAGHTLDRKAGPERQGSAIVVEEGATLAIADSEGDGMVTGAYDERGGVVVWEGGSFSLHDGSIAGNESTFDGGGICSSGSVTIYGGTVGGNRAARGGGGLYLEEGASLTMYGGRVVDNVGGSSYDSYGAGVYVSGTARVFMEGGPKIKGNVKTDGSRSNVHLSVGADINVTGALEGADVYVSKWEGFGLFTTGYGDCNYGVPPAEFFHADVSEYSVVEIGGQAAIIPSADAAAVDAARALPASNGAAGAQFDVYVAEGLEKGSVTFEVVGVGSITTPVEKAVPLGGDLYRFDVPIAPKNLTDELKVTFLHAKADPIDITGDYGSALDALLEPGDAYGFAMGEYAKAADTYLRGNAHELSPATTGATVEGYAAKATSGAVEGLTDTGYALVHNAKLYYKQYFKLTGDVSDYTAKVNGKKAALVQSGGEYYVKVPSVKSSAWASARTVTISKGDETYTVTFSACAYAQSKATSSKEPLANLAKSMHGYYQATQ